MGRDQQESLFNDEDFEPNEDSKEEYEREIEPSIEERNEQLETVDESDNGYMLLERPWSKEKRWQVTRSNEEGPVRRGSPNGGCLYPEEEKKRAEKYFELMSELPTDVGSCSVPG